MENAAEADERPVASAEFEALFMLVEAHLLTLADEEALSFLRRAAAVLERHDTNVVALRVGAEGARAERQARSWLRRNLTVWLAKYG